MEKKQEEHNKKEVNIEKELDIIKQGVGTQETVISEIGKDLTRVAKAVKELQNKDTLLEVKEVTRDEKNEQKKAVTALAAVYTQIGNRRNEMHAQSNKQTDLEKQIKYLEYKTRKVVLTATDAETGKTLYTNDKARETALWEKLNEDEEYAKIQEDLKKCQYRQVELENEMKSLRDKARVLNKCVEIGFYINLKESEDKWV